MIYITLVVPYMALGFSLLSLWLTIFYLRRYLRLNEARKNTINFLCEDLDLEQEEIFQSSKYIVRKDQYEWD